jgi:hypothetical protein
MQIRPQSWIYVAALAVFGTGCTSLSTTGDDARAARLPTGVTLLESDRNQCAGAVTIDDSSLASARRSDLVIQRGQNAVFEVDADANDDVEIEWTCVGEADTDRGSAECPDETSHVRITRDSTGNNFLLECYGDEDDRRRASR